ncbi:proline dehydrogenase [Sphaerisporangium album]|uniref:Proline dehydrogenase n=1 Tax=Sphaerisporangium album TaxID=509200 RepID=A0A367FL38_9ACTN|nr:proline dehydrogenase [Sphaerisporangium album]
MLRRVLLAASSNDRVESMVRTSGIARRVMSRYVAGTGVEDAASAAAALTADGYLVTLDHLGEEARGPAQAARAADTAVALLDALDRRGAAKGADLSVRLSVLGLHVDEGLARDCAARVCAAAGELGATVTVDTENAALADRALRVHACLVEDHPSTGAAVQAALRGAEHHCRALAAARVRLCAGTPGGPASVSYGRPADVDRSYVRCLKVLMEGGGYPMVATHDRRLIEVASALAVLNEREPGSFEYQMWHGVRPPALERQAAHGARVRVRVPYGPGWYGHLARHFAGRTGNLADLVRSMAGRREVTRGTGSRR